MFASRGLEEQGEFGLENIVIDFFSEGKISQKHGRNHACEEDDSLRPRLVGEFASAMVEVSDAFSPSVDREQSHDYYSPYK